MNNKFSALITADFPPILFSFFFGVEVFRHLESVRAALAKIPGSMSNLIISERGAGGSQK